MGESSGSSSLTTREGFLSTTRREEYAPEHSELEKAQAAHHQGELHRAEQLYRKILEAEPNGDAAAGLGALLRSDGRSSEAGRHYRWALTNCNWTPILLSNASNWLREQGHSTESLSWLAEGLKRWPRNLHLSWGMVLSLHQAGHPEEALRHLETLLDEQGRRPLLLRELVACQLDCELWLEALTSTKELREKEPNDVSLLQQELILLQRLQRQNEAWELLNRQSILKEKDFISAKAVLLLSEHKHYKALPLFSELIELEPEEANHWLNLAACQKALKKMVAPLRTLEEAVKIHPKRGDLLQALGSLLVEHGRWSEGLDVLTKSVSQPNSSDVQHFNLQFAAAGNRILSSTELKKRAEKWEDARRLFPSPLWSDHLRNVKPDKRLRIGYLSQDLHNHPVGRFLEPLVRAHDRQQVEVLLITCGSIQDEQSIKLERLCDQWVALNDSRDHAAARHLAELELDILIELGGYTGGQRIRLLTAKPAPIQLSYLGYFASTHLRCIDGWIGDDVVFPKNIEEESQNQLIYRLPRSYMCYQPESSLIPQRTAPDERFRFGCFNHSRKLTEPTLDLFAKVLQGVPNSLLVLKSQTFGELEERERIRARCEERGIEPERLKILERSVTTQEHLSMYGQIDVALDPIPYGGATTSAEALWMGVPVICLAGEGMVGRLSAAILKGAGLTSAIAKDIEGYIIRAKTIANLGPRTDNQRIILRQHIKNSELMDERGLAQAMEQCFRFYWQSWTESKM